MDKCKFCGQKNVDGGRNYIGEFICIDCIALNDEANQELHSMCPYQPIGGPLINYPQDCYDVSRYKRVK